MSSDVHSETGAEDDEPKSLYEEVQELKGEKQELKNEKKELRAILEAQNKKIQALTELLIGEGRSLIEDDIENRQPVLDQLDEHATLSETALAVAKSETDTGEGTKKAAAKRAAKVELVKRCTLKDNGKSQLEVTEIPDLVAPKYQLQHAEAKRVVDDLCSDWDCFRFAEGTKKKSGPNDRLKAAADEIPPELARMTMREVANDDLAYRVSSQILDEGGQ